MANATGNFFPPWMNLMRAVLAVGAGGGAVYAATIVLFGFSPQATDVGYAPVQPVPYSHALHAGKLGLDCRYCHTSVESGLHANIPPTQTCMGCHSNVTLPADRKNRILPVEESHRTGNPIRWVRIHDLPDYAYFDHGAHVRRGVGCVSCHGRIDTMDVVQQDQPLSMQWCLDCHRNPEKHLRPMDQVTNMNWTPPNGDQNAFGLELMKQYGIKPSQDCSTCHR